jgi:hypothetical protein
MLNRSMKKKITYQLQEVLELKVTDNLPSSDINDFLKLNFRAYI